MQNSLLKFLEFQDFRIKFRIVADAARFKEYQDKLNKTAFVPIRSRVEFVDYEALSNLHTKMAASAAIEKIVNL